MAHTDPAERYQELPESVLAGRSFEHAVMDAMTALPKRQIPEVLLRLVVAKVIRHPYRKILAGLVIGHRLSGNPDYVHAVKVEGRAPVPTAEDAVDVDELFAKLRG